MRGALLNCNGRARCMLRDGDLAMSLTFDAYLALRLLRQMIPTELAQSRHVPGSGG